MPTASDEPPLRVGLCITELNVGGAERCLVELATRLDRSRFAPVVYCLGGRPESNAAALVDRLETANVPVRFFNGRGWRDVPRVGRQLRRAFQADRLDLVQTFLFHANVLGTIAAWRARVPRIVTGLRVAEPSRRGRRPVERLAGRLADRHVAVSEGVARFACEKIGLRRDKIVVIPNGIALRDRADDADTDDTHREQELARLGVPGGRRAIAFVGRLDHQKGIDWLIEQSPVLFKLLPSHDLLVAGAGPLESRLRTRVDQLGIADRVHFLGWRDDVPVILSAADLLVVPSQWEGMSNVILEAMAAARPIVAFDVEGVADTIGDRASPQIVAAADQSGFIKRVVELAVNVQLRRELGAANRRRIESEFTLDKMIAKYERIFLALCRPGTAL